MPAPIPLPAAARDAILDWYAVNGRDLPFRVTTDPWAILVSEAMAQQTQAARAGEAWIRFMEAFPTAGALAAASPADVLRAWQGLGYNRRALNLWRTARQIVELHAGIPPADLHALEALPGVGPYTARAVAAIAFGMPVGAVDTNVRRVLGRIVDGDTSLDGRGLQAVADDAVPPDRAGTWTHALMDLGATICRPRRPDCDACPARAWCRYAAIAPTGIAQGQSTRGPFPGHPPAPIPFTATTRWLRGRIIDRLREAGSDGWTTIDGPIGIHDHGAVTSALRSLQREGLVELEESERPSRRRARLSLE